MYSPVLLRQCMHPWMQLPGFKRILNYIKKVEEQEVRRICLALMV